MLARFDEIPSMTLNETVYTKAIKITKGNNSNSIGPYSLIFIISICLEDRNVFERFDEIPSMSLFKILRKLSIQTH